MTSKAGFPNPSPPWGMIDIILVLLLFFLLPGWVRSALGLIPEPWREAYITIHESDLPEGMLKETAKKTPPAEGALPPAWVKLPSFLRKIAEQVNNSELVKRIRIAEEQIRLAAGKKAAPPKENAEPETPFQGEHPLTVLILVSKRVPRLTWFLALAFAAAVVTAPFAEELVFRVVLLRGLLRYIPSAFLTIVLQALFFAFIHIRSPEGVNDIEKLNRILTGVGAMVISHILLTLFILAWLRGVRHAEWRDLGFTRQGLIRGILKGVGLFLLVWPLMLAAQRIVQAVMPQAVPDPVPIFILALGLGTLFLRTRQFAANLAMHISLNFVSFCGILLLAR